MKYCSECGCENLDEAQFCRNCGSKLKAETNEIAQKQATSDIKEVKRQEVTPNVTVNKNMNSIVSKLFYKTDKYTGELRIAKTKTISIVVFVVMFFCEIGINLPEYSFAIVLITGIIFGLIFAVPTYIIGYLLGLAIDKLTH
ncbi:zinc-ribbon domain-containing protein [Methanobrevibacter sp.]|uniref:zinc-ribbon domain-containing protein n=1 Tax=Methanobrevibacter sp. TaxID=66852 RepID=UPI00386DBE9F